MNLSEEIEQFEVEMDLKKLKIEEKERELKKCIEKIKSLKQILVKMSFFKPDEIGPILSYIVSGVEEDDYVYGTAQYCCPIWVQGNSWLIYGGKNAVIVKKGFENCEFMRKINNYEDPLVLAKIVHVLGKDAEKRYNFMNSFESGPFPYLDDFIVTLACSRYENEGKVPSYEEMLPMADEFINNQKTVKVQKKLVKKEEN